MPFHLGARAKRLNGAAEGAAEGSSGTWLASPVLSIHSTTGPPKGGPRRAPPVSPLSATHVGGCEMRGTGPLSAPGLSAEVVM